VFVLGNIKSATSGVNLINILQAAFFAHKMLMKLNKGLNFINVLQAAFAHLDPKSAKRY